LKCGNLTGSIHAVAKALMNDAPVNGWDVWFYKDELGKKIVIDELREKLRATAPLPTRERRGEGRSKDES
jgi:hypothetical protein